MVWFNDGRNLPAMLKPGSYKQSNKQTNQEGRKKGRKEDHARWFAGLPVVGFSALSNITPHVLPPLLVCTWLWE